MIHWAHPDVHLYLIALLPLSVWLLYALRRREKTLQQAIHPSLWPTLIPTYSSKRIRSCHALRLLVTSSYSLWLVHNGAMSGSPYGNVGFTFSSPRHLQKHARPRPKAHPSSTSQMGHP